MKKEDPNYAKWSKEDLIKWINDIESEHAITLELLALSREDGAYYRNMFKLSLDDNNNNDMAVLMKKSNNSNLPLSECTSIAVLERIAFDPKTPEKEAKKALRQLIKITKKK